MLCSSILVLLLLSVQGKLVAEHKRQKRYLVFTPFTQYGVFATVSIALPAPDNLVNVAWFLEANYYNVDNSSYFEPLLGDIELSRSRQERNTESRNDMLTRSSFYAFIEAMLRKHGYPGRGCLLRSICETATTHYSHNGLLGDMIQLILTPSSSLPEEDLKDCYYEAEFYGLEDTCGSYVRRCPSSPLDHVTMYMSHYNGYESL